MIDKKTSKQIDNIVSAIKMTIWKESIKITEKVQREIEKRLIKTIQDRWEYIDNITKKEE